MAIETYATRDPEKGNHKNEKETKEKKQKKPTDST
jgi:hypothetical protein